MLLFTLTVEEKYHFIYLYLLYSFEFSYLDAKKYQSNHFLFNFVLASLLLKAREKYTICKQDYYLAFLHFPYRPRHYLLSIYLYLFIPFNILSRTDVSSTFITDCFGKDSVTIL